MLPRSAGRDELLGHSHGLRRHAPVGLEHFIRQLTAWPEPGWLKRRDQWRSYEHWLVCVHGRGERSAVCSSEVAKVLARDGPTKDFADHHERFAGRAGAGGL